MYFLLKVGLTALMVAGISELGKRFSLWAAILASLPLTSILAMIWIYSENKDVAKISELSYGIFWMVIPSLIFFIVLPLFIKWGIRFYPALLLSCLIMAMIYPLYAIALRRFGISI